MELRVGEVEPVVVDDGGVEIGVVVEPDGEAVLVSITVVVEVELVDCGGVV